MISIIRNLPIGRIPSTPTIKYADDDTSVKTLEATACLLEHAAEFGNTVGYVQEQFGSLVQNIYPIKRDESNQISSSSKTVLELHTETAFHSYRPDYVFLLCLRGDPNAHTTYANIEDILEKLSPETIKILENKWFRTRVDESFMLDKQEGDVGIDVAVLSRLNNGSYTIRYDRALMTGLWADAQDALLELSDAINKSTQSVALDAGDLLVIDNNTAVHGRSDFQPRYDGTDRWLKRALVMRVLPPGSDRDGNVITTKLCDIAGKSRLTSDNTYSDLLHKPPPG